MSQTITPAHHHEIIKVSWVLLKFTCVCDRFELGTHLRVTYILASPLLWGAMYVCTRSQCQSLRGAGEWGPCWRWRTLLQDDPAIKLSCGSWIVHLRKRHALLNYKLLRLTGYTAVHCIILELLLPVGTLSNFIAK